MSYQERTERLCELLRERILVLDGAMGTTIQQLDLQPEDFGGIEYEGCNENLVLTRPEAIARVHDDFLEAGADIIETDTFGSASVVLVEYDLADRAREISRVAAEIARRSADAHSTIAGCRAARRRIRRRTYPRPSFDGRAPSVMAKVRVRA